MAGRTGRREKARFFQGSKYKKANIARAECVRGDCEGGGGVGSDEGQGEV